MASEPAEKMAFCSAQGPVATVPLALLLQLVEVEFQVPPGVMPAPFVAPLRSQ